MVINSQTALLGLLGNPVTHSLSPLIHNSIFQQKSMNAAYLCFEVRPDSLASAVEGLKRLGAVGFNLTIPHKEKVIPLLDGVSEEVRLIHAVNTVKNNKGKLVGYNTDGAGFIDSLKLKGGFSPQGKEACILGAGGAARSVAFYLCKEGVASLGLYDIERPRAKALAHGLKKIFKNINVTVLDRKEGLPESAALLINATGVGMRDSDPALLDATFFGRRKDLFVYDLIYNPAKPALLNEAERQGLKTMNGLWMLVYQALRALTIWFERDDFLQMGDFCYNLLQEVEVEAEAAAEQEVEKR